MMRRVILSIVCVLFAFGAVASLRLWLRGRSALELAQSAEAQDAFWAAADGYQQAMRAYLPGCETSQLGADGLERLAKKAEARLNASTSSDERAIHRSEALEAWRRLRGGVWATRSFWKPFGDRQALADERIAELMADEILASGAEAIIRGRDRATLVADHRALLARDPTPSPWWSMLCFFCFCGFVGSVFGWIFKGFDAEGHRCLPYFWCFGLCWVACFGLWAVSLWLA